MGLTPLRVAVTGASGFIGREIFDWSQLPDQHDMRLISRDRTEVPPDDWLQGSTLLHLAGKFAGDRDELWSSNVEYTREILNWFGKKKGARILFLSTGAIYGSALHATGSREDDVPQPVNYYGYTKWIAETLIEYEWGSESDHSYQILRLPNVYGERQPKGVVNAMYQAITGKGEVTIAGDGEQKRDFLHVSDVVRALDLALRHPEQSGAFNISSDLTLTLNQLSEIISEGRQVKKNRVPDTNGLRELVLDITKARRCFGFEPAVNRLLLQSQSAKV
jgi:nucleoside-diphosphate-sugar epimerase